LKTATVMAPGWLCRTAITSIEAPSSKRRTRVIVVLLTMVVCSAGWLAWRHIGGWAGALFWITQTQYALHQQLADAVQAVATDGTATAAPLLGLSLLYGVFHAAGPGHGKAVIATYLGTHGVHVRRGVLLSVLAALAQGLVAIMLIEAVEAAVAVFGLSLRRAQALGMQAENLSFGLIAVLGAVLAVRSLLALWRRRQRGSAGRAMQLYCIDCTRPHGPTRAQLHQPLSWRTSASLILAIGLRPCTGAVLVLLFAHTLGLRWTAVAAVLAMSLGTATTVAVLAVLAVSVRQAGIGLLQRVNRSGAFLGLVLNLLGAVGGLLILLMGAGLLLQEMHSRVHPLL